MAGYSVRQAAALTGMKDSYFRQNANKIRGAYKETNEWHFPIDGLAEFIISKRKVLIQFRVNMRESSCPSQYRQSGKILLEKIDSILDQELDEPIEFLTSKDICSLPFGDYFQYKKAVTDLCKNKKLFAFKEGASTFSPWRIPTESFAIFLALNVDVYNVYTNMIRANLSYWKEKDHKMYKIGNSIKHYLNKIPFIFDETYNIDDLSDIFDIPRNEVVSTFFSKYFMQHVIPVVHPFVKDKRISWRTVAEYLRNHPDKKQDLCDKWERLFKEGSDKERAVRHLLMLCEYYE